MGNILILPLSCSHSVKTVNINMYFLFSRIFEILPSRLLQWQAKPCVSEIKNKEQLEKIRQQQLELRKQLVELDKKHQEIDELIERAKKSTILSEEEVNPGITLKGSHNFFKWQNTVYFYLGIKRIRIKTKIPLFFEQNICR